MKFFWSHHTMLSEQAMSASVFVYYVIQLWSINSICIIKTSLFMIIIKTWYMILIRASFQIYHVPNNVLHIILKPQIWILMICTSQIDIYLHLFIQNSLLWYKNHHQSYHIILAHEVMINYQSFPMKYEHSNH